MSRREYMKEWREKNREHRKKYKTEYWRKNKERLSKYRKKYDRKRKREIVKLLGGKCEICGYNKCFGALEFHHVDPNEKETTHILKSKKSIEKLIRLWKEGKIKLLCSNCHHEEHERINNAQEEREREEEEKARNEH